jgi:hypothetical protein
MSFLKNMSSHISNKVFQCYSLVLYHIVKNVAVLLWNECRVRHPYVDEMVFIWYHVKYTDVINVFLKHDMHIDDVCILDMTSTFMT